MNLFIKMNGADSVFEEVSIQHRTNNAYTYTCVRGYFENRLCPAR
ncbi:hypothetical protein [Chitinophaga sp. RAB17]